MIRDKKNFKALLHKVIAIHILVAVVAIISSVVTRAVIYDGVSKRISLAGMDQRFDSARCRSIALDRYPQIQQ